MYVAPEEADLGSSVAEASRQAQSTIPFALEGPSLVTTETIPFVY